MGGDFIHCLQDRVYSGDLAQVGEARGGGQRYAERIDERGAVTAEGAGRENRELRRANEILRKSSAFFAQAEL
jgi:hypothetical protein